VDALGTVDAERVEAGVGSVVVAADGPAPQALVPISVPTSNNTATTGCAVVRRLPARPALIARHGTAGDGASKNFGDSWSRVSSATRPIRGDGEKGDRADHPPDREEINR
jgi:hypothetical protein